MQLNLLNFQDESQLILIKAGQLKQRFRKARDTGLSFLPAYLFYVLQNPSKNQTLEDFSNIFVVLSFALVFYSHCNFVEHKYQPP